jgi:hypothetical protein
MYTYRSIEDVNINYFAEFIMNSSQYVAIAHAQNAIHLSLRASNRRGKILLATGSGRSHIDKALRLSAVLKFADPVFKECKRVLSTVNDCK